MNQMSCGKCGKSIDSSAKFCPECGAPTATAAPVVNNQTVKNATAGKSNFARDGMIVVGVLIVVTAGFFIFKGRAERPVDPSTQTAATDDPHSSGMSTELLESLPADYPGLIQAGNQFYDEGSFAVAAEVYSRALAVDDSSPDVRTDYGACLYAMGLAQRAAEEFRTVVKTNPEHSIANFNLGIVYHSMQLEDSARFYWEKYLELDPDGPPAATARQLLKELDS